MSTKMRSNGDGFAGLVLESLAALPDGHGGRGVAMAFLADIDGSGDARLIEQVFTRWGRHCYGAHSELARFAGDLRGYVEYVNGHHAPHWERVECDATGSVIRISSREAGRCPCAAQPLRSLCRHCCRSFQAELFRDLTGREVDVEIEESILLGGERCRATVRLRGAQERDRH